MPAPLPTSNIVETQVINTAAEGYLKARERGVDGIVPGDALWAVLDRISRSGEASIAVKSPEDVHNFMRMAGAVTQKVAELEAIDPKG